MAKKRKTPLETSSTSDSSPALTQNSSPTVIQGSSSPAPLYQKTGSTSIQGSSAVQGSSAALVQSSHEFIEENIKGALLDWLKEQPIYQGGSSNDRGAQEKVMNELADGLTSIMKQTPNSDNMDSVLLEQIKKNVQKFPVNSKQKSNQQSLDELPVQILDHLKSLQLFHNISVRDDRPLVSKNVKKKAAVMLLEDIANWVDNLPIETDSPEDAENTKEQLESKLIHKIGELNMNSEIFNDDFIYDDILGDEVENLLADAPGKNIENELPKLKKELLAIVKKARKKIREENAGLIYKQQLCETITKTLPLFDLSLEGKASFEVLKDDVADAFISMHYVGNDEEEANKLKKKINDQIYTFCRNYLKRCPASPIDTTKLNKALYNALKNIVEPQNESFRNDVELVKIKDEINNWAKELPLKNQAGQEKLQTYKMISVLAKKMYEIENEKEIIPNEEYEEKMKKEIVKFLKKLPLTTENDDDINELVDKLVKSLRDTEETRKLNASVAHCVQPIVKRASRARLRISFNDVSSSPCPVETCSQTSSFSKCPGPNQCLVQKSSSVQTPCKRMQAIGSQIDVTPNVIVNEYHWDSIDENDTEPPRIPCPCPTTTRPSYAVIPQPIQSPASPRRDDSCMQPPQFPCTSPTAPHPPYEAVPQRFHSPNSRRASDCTPAALKSCLTTRPFPPQPFENQFIKPRDPDQSNPCDCAPQQIQAQPPCALPYYDYDDYDYQLSEAPAPCSLDPQAESTQAGKQCSDQSFVSMLDEHNSFQTGNQSSNPCQLQQTLSSSPPYPYHLYTDPVPRRPEPSPQRNRVDSLSNQYPRQPCPCPTRETPRQRNVQESQYISYTSCPGSPQVESRNRRPLQNTQPIITSPYMTSCPPHFSRGQNMTPRSSISFSPSPQMPCAYNPRSPCYVRPEPQLSPEEYDVGMNCSFQKSATRLGTYDDEEPQTCMSRYRDWGKVREDFEYWERDRQHFDSVETNNHREGRRCRVCRHKYGGYTGRRY